MSKEPIDPPDMALALEYVRPLTVARTAVAAAQALVKDLEALVAEQRAEIERLRGENAALRRTLQINALSVRP